MPKVTGPLFSVTATGQLAGVLDYTMHGGTCTVRQKRRWTPPPNALQALQQQAVGQMSDCWGLQTQAYRDTWAARGPAYGLTGYQLFWKQWFIQGSTCANLPILP